MQVLDEGMEILLSPPICLDTPDIRPPTYEPAKLMYWERKYYQNYLIQRHNT